MRAASPSCSGRSPQDGARPEPVPLTAATAVEMLKLSMANEATMGATKAVPVRSRLRVCRFESSSPERELSIFEFLSVIGMHPKRFMQR